MTTATLVTRPEARNGPTARTVNSTQLSNRICCDDFRAEITSSSLTSVPHKEAVSEKERRVTPMVTGGMSADRDPGQIPALTPPSWASLVKLTNYLV